MGGLGFSARALVNKSTFRVLLILASFLMVGVSYSANATSGYAKQVIADGANHYYRLLELGGNTVADSVGNSPGTVVGDLTLGLDGAIAEGGDKAARFSNGSSYITATGADLNFKGALSIEAWLINENESPARYISDGINADRGIGVGITDFNRDEHDYVLFFTSLGVKDYISDVQLPRDGKFHHVVITLDANYDVRFYVDGEFRQLIEGQNAPKDSDLHLTIGQNAGGATLDSWTGLIDDISIYPSVLTNEQISEHYRLGVSAPPISQLIFADGYEPAPQPLQNTNLNQGETLSYPLAFVSGEYPLNDSVVRVSDGTNETNWPIYDGRFKVLARLREGQNKLLFRFPNETRSLDLNYESPSASNKKVRLFYYLGSDGSGEIDAPPGVDNGLPEAMKRMKLGALMLQTFFAETYKRSRESQTGLTDLPRETFQLELDENNDPIVHIIRSASTQMELWNLDDGAANWGEAVTLLYEYDNSRGEIPDDFVHMGRSGIAHLDPDTGIYKAGVCLGGGGLMGAGVGMCHAANLITHAPTVDSIHDHFTDNTPFDPNYIVEDSQGRGNYWGSFAATLGGLMHETGHAFSLPHVNVGVMASDFGSINRFFTVYEVQPDGSRLPITKDTELRHPEPQDWWHPDSVEILEQSPFIH